MRVLSLLLFFAIATLFCMPSSMADNFNNPLVDAADLGQKDKVLKLLKSGYKPDSKGDFGVTPLMRAAFRGYLDIVKILIDSGAYVNASDVGGETALHLAARNGYTEIAKELIDNDAFIDTPDKEKWTPLMRAVTSKQTSTASFLIEQGADLTAVNEQNQSVLVNAAIVGKPEIIKLILGNKNFSKIPQEQQKLALAQAEKRGHEEAGRLLSATSDYTKKQKQNRAVASNDLDDEDYDSRESRMYEKKAPKPSAKPKAIITVRDQSSDNEEELAISKKLNNAQLSKAEEESKSIYESASRALPKSEKPKDITKNLNNEQLASNSDSFYDDSFYTMQLGSYPNEDRASDIWNNLKNRNSDVLGRLNPDVLEVKSDSSKSGAYYLRAGHYRWKDIAEASCSSLRTRNIECLVVPGSVNQYNIANKAAAKSETKQTAAAERPVGRSPNAPTDLASAKSTGQQQYNEQQQAYNETSPPEDLPWMRDAKTANAVQQENLPRIGKAEIPPQYQESPANKPTPEQMSGFTKKVFSDSKPTSDSKKEKDYKGFYKDIEKTEKKPVSEAVLVPDETYFANNTASGSSGGNWVEIGNFGNKDMANDYADRMLRYDENLSSLQISIAEATDDTGNKITIRVGPASGDATETICTAARAGGLQCASPRGNTATPAAHAQLASISQPAPQRTIKYWINLGTFSDSSEAEYYWAFLHEDNQDLLSNMKYDISSDSNSDLGNSAIQLKAGPFPSENKAKQICNVLRYRNVACLVQ